MSTNRTLLYVAAGVLALVVLAVGIVLLAEARGPAVFPAGSPQDVMQRYLDAWEDEDYAAAYAFFSDEVQAGYSLERFESEARRSRGDLGTGVERAIFIDQAEENGDAATVYLTVEEYYGDGNSSYRSQREVLMVREDGTWKIDQPLLGVELGPFGDRF